MREQGTKEIYEKNNNNRSNNIISKRGVLIIIIVSRFKHTKRTLLHAENPIKRQARDGIFVRQQLHVVSKKENQ